ncbi:MAG: GC-type dockerin domain-anchored protein, partial [Phycisphaerales bacterium]|nr:GC-type dockerin domain-anchored protein [Phycisphaerales bacterium]
GSPLGMFCTVANPGWLVFREETPPCPADMNGDGVVDVIEVLLLLDAWGQCEDCAADINGDGIVDTDDLLSVLAAWGACD